MGKGEYILARVDVVALTSISKCGPESENVFDSLEEIVCAINRDIRRLCESSGIDLTIKVHPLYGDTFDIYFKSGDYDCSLMLVLLEAIADIQRTALNYRFFVKGAIVKGELLISDQAFTGKAMVEAKEMEDRCRWPCISVSNEIMELIKDAADEAFQSQSDAHEFMDKVLREEFLNYLEVPTAKNLKCIPDEELRAHRGSLISTVNRYIEILSLEIDKREKQISMYEYALKNHNAACSKYHSVETI